MKRGADNYITKDSEPDDEIEEVPGEGFRKADEAVLATRKIRALPKRSMAGTPPPAAASNGLPTSEPTSSPTPKFNGFSGFGTPSGPFSFTPSLSPSPSFTKNSSSPFSFPSSSSTPPAASSVTPTASSTAKAFASFLDDSSTRQPKPTTTVDPASQGSRSSQTSNTDDSHALNYYKSLRGLNLSLLSAITKAIEDDPFNDVAEVLERYKTLRLNARNEFDEHSKVSTPTPHVNPAPPSTFVGFGLPTLKPAMTPGGNGGFVPTPSTTTSPAPGFTFPTSTLPTPGFSFNTLPASKPQSEVPINPFGSSSSVSLTFGTSMSNPSTPPILNIPSTSTSPAPSTFGDTKSASTTNPFSSAPSSSSISERPTPLHPFGAPPSQPKSSNFGGFGGFGNSAGSIGNPVGFSFGSPPRTSTESRGPGTAEDAIGVEDTYAQTTESETKGTHIGGMLPTSPHDEEGEGEEQEDTIYAVKLKAYRLKKEDEKGGTGWIELGYGVLRLKKHKDTEARRMLLRNSSSGKININFKIYSGLKPSQVKKTVTFIGHDNGISQTYNVRLQNEEQATRLKEVLEKEIASVKSISDS